MSRTLAIAALLAAVLSFPASGREQSPEEMRREIEAEYQRLKKADEEKASAAKREEELAARAGKPAVVNPGTGIQFSTDTMAIYAASLGRGIACGANTDGPMRRVGRWLDDAFPAGGSEKTTYLVILAEGIKHHAMLQKSGRTSDSCATVLRELQRTPWP